MDCALGAVPNQTEIELLVSDTPLDLSLRDEFGVAGQRAKSATSVRRRAA
jgi:hypothetical protein